MSVRCAVVGSGNIGSDLIVKIGRSDVLEPVLIVGVDPASDGLRRAREAGVEVTSNGVDALRKVGGAGRGKAIIILNPAKPPVIMRNTVFAAVPPPVREEGFSSPRSSPHS